MMTSQVHHSHTTKTLIPFHKPFISGSGRAFSLSLSKLAPRKKQNNICTGIRLFCRAVKPGATFVEKSTRVKAIVTVKVTLGDSDSFGPSISLELVSAELDPKTGMEKETIKEKAKKMSEDKNEVKYECAFLVRQDFGEIGAVLVKNIEHKKGIYIKTIALDGLLNGNVIMNCNSWVAPKDANQEKRVFFTNKSYLPSRTPKGLRRLREKELEEIRGNGQGERKTWDRIYDYDVYNDLGDPDRSKSLKRPVLGGQEHPYPRRCRTGRPMCKTDPTSETRSSNIYVPKDEVFSNVKSITFSANVLYSVLHALVPSLEGAIEDKDNGFLDFAAIDSLFNETDNIQISGKGHLKGMPWKFKGISLFNGRGDIPGKGDFKDILPRIVKAISETGKEVLRFEIPAMFERDAFSWFRDEEFSRQTLAGLNPCSIKLVSEWPLKSKLDPNIFGPPESAITKEIIECQIRGLMTLEEAMEQKKLFILDYHDLLLPFVKRVREIEGTTLYGSRALFFLTLDGTLRPLAIELTRPPMDGKPQWKQVFTPTWDASGSWLWRLAKTHVLAHDSGYHQLVSHWLRTHCATEPYIIATNRQLSALHPIYRLLHPHFRYTMEINAMGRGSLINANGIIETRFSPAKYCMELSSVAYDIEWQFDHQALPVDLISRGMAVEDPMAPHGLRLTIEDYPFANDGLILWDAIKQWVTDYVQHYYPDSALVESDKELQAWWTEIRTVGHADKKDETWWPGLKTADDLIGILTTMIWVASGHHSAVNFGQYPFAGYFPNRATIARAKMTTEDPTDEEMKRFHTKPGTVLLQCFPSQIQATKVMAIIDVLSNHSPDEEYIGKEIEGVWAENPKIKAAFQQFNRKLKELEQVIDFKNTHTSKFKNRSGAGVVPYELLKPFSGPGVTGKGVPNSISI